MAFIKAQRERPFFLYLAHAIMPAGGEGKDPRAPDGVTILAPAEQYTPASFPGVIVGDPLSAGALFDPEADPAEQRNVAAQHPEIVARLKGMKAP